MTRFGKLKRIVKVYHVEESATAVQCRVKSSAVKMVIEELKTLSQVSQDLHIPLQTLHSCVNKGRKGELSTIELAI